MPIYQQLFTFLLQIYRVKYLLQNVRPTRSQTMNRTTSRITHRLRHRLTWFADILRSYLTESVVFFTTQDMEAAMSKAQDIDEMSQIQIKFVARLQERALLSKGVKPIHNAVVDILDLGILYAEAVGNNGNGMNTKPDVKGKSRKSTARCKSTVVEAPMDDSEDSDEDEDAKHETSAPSSASVRRTPTETLQHVEGELARLIPFVTAGLRSVGRVGAEPMWEQLAEKLEWEGKKDRS